MWVEATQPFIQDRGLIPTDRTIAACTEVDRLIDLRHQALAPEQAQEDGVDDGAS